MAIDIIARGMIESSKNDISQLFDITKGGEIVSNESSYTLNNAVDYPLLGLNLYGKSTQDGVPTPDTPVDIVSVGDSGTVNITSNNGGDITVTAAITSALPLCGIPVESGGNYTDSNGRQWICDELIYNADGTGKIVKHTVNTIITSDGSTLSSTNDVIANSEYNMPYQTAEAGVNRFKIPLLGLNTSFIIDNDNSVLCSAYEFKKGSNNTWFRTAQFGTDGEALWLCDPDNFNDLNGFYNYIKNNPLELVYPLAEPQEIELTAAEMSQLRQLRTFDGVTSISNSAGAEMSVKYCTNKALSEYVLPITKGLQMQIDELRAAVLSLGGNV